MTKQQAKRITTPAAPSGARPLRGSAPTPPRGPRGGRENAAQPLFGLLLWYLRTAQGCTQEALLERLDEPLGRHGPSWVSRLEGGEVVVLDHELIDALAGALRCTDEEHIALFLAASPLQVFFKPISVEPQRALASFIRLAQAIIPLLPAGAKTASRVSELSPRIPNDDVGSAKPLGDVYEWWPQAA